MDSKIGLVPRSANLEKNTSTFQTKCIPTQTPRLEWSPSSTLISFYSIWKNSSPANYHNIHCFLISLINEDRVQHSSQIVYNHSLLRLTSYIFKCQTNYQLSQEQLNFICIFNANLTLLNDLKKSSNYIDYDV